MTRQSELRSGSIAGVLPTSIQREMFGSPHVTTRPETIRSDDELFGFFYNIRNDRYYKDSLGLSLVLAGAAIGITKQDVYHIITQRYLAKKGHRGSGWKAPLSRLMDDIEAGRVGWRGREEIRFEPPNPLPPGQPPLILLDDWNWWARCRSCSNRRYQVILVTGRYHAACTYCVDPLTVGGVYDPQRLPLPIS